MALQTHLTLTVLDGFDLCLSSLYYVYETNMVVIWATNQFCQINNLLHSPKKKETFNGNLVDPHQLDVKRVFTILNDEAISNPTDTTWKSRIKSDKYSTSLITFRGQLIINYRASITAPCRVSSTGDPWSHLTKNAKKIHFLV